MKTLIRVLGCLAIYAPFAAGAILLSMHIGPIQNQLICAAFALGTATPPLIIATLFDNWFKRKYQPHLITIEFILK